MFWLVALLITVGVALAAPLIIRARRRSRGETADQALTQAGTLITVVTLSVFAFSIVGPYFITAPKWLWVIIGVSSVAGGISAEKALTRRGIKLLRPIK